MTTHMFEPRQKRVRGSAVFIWQGATTYLRRKITGVASELDVGYSSLVPEYACWISRNSGAGELANHLPTHRAATLPDAPVPGANLPGAGAGASLAGEAFAMVIDEAGIAIQATGERGLRYALSYVAEARRTGRPLRLGEYADWPTMRMRGVMVDVARVTEKPETLHEVIELLGRFRANTMMLYVEQKFPLRKYRDIVTADGYTLGQMKALAKHAGEYGIEVLPSFSLFGHATHILNLPQYRHMSDGPQTYQLNPLHPEVADLCVDHIDSWNATIPSGLMHMGCDETPYMGLCKQTADYLAQHGKAGLFARHVNFMHDELKQRGQRMMIWGDMLRHHPDIAEMISNEIIICDWNYGPIDEAWRPGMQRLRKLGFDVVVVPAASRSAEMFVPDQVHCGPNIPPFVKMGVEEGAMGCLVSSWEGYTLFSPWSRVGYAQGLQLAWTGDCRPGAVREATGRAYAAVFGDAELAEVARRTVGIVGGQNMMRQMRRTHFNKAVKRKTYHLVTHEVTATDPMLYGTAGTSAFHRMLQRKHREMARLLKEDIAGQEPMATFLADCLSWSNMMAEIRLRPQAMVRALREAKGAMRADDAATCVRHLQTAMGECEALGELSAEAMRSSRGWWDQMRLAEDPLYERYHGRRWRWSRDACRSWADVLSRSIRAVEAGREPTVFDQWADKRVLMCCLPLEADEVNILRLHVERSDDGLAWEEDFQIESFQQPGSEYCYTWLPWSAPEHLRFTVTRTQTPWTLDQMRVEVYALPSLTTRPGYGFKCDDYRLGRLLGTALPRMTGDEQCVVSGLRGTLGEKV